MKDFIFHLWLAFVISSAGGLRPSFVRSRRSVSRAMISAADEERLPFDENLTAWALGFRSIVKNNAFIDAYNSRQPILLAGAVHPSSAASTFGSASLLASAQHDSSIPVGQVEWGPNQGWRNTRLADSSAVARALGTAGMSGQGNISRGGVVINDAGVAIPELAPLCSLSMEAFQLPIGLNVYSTLAQPIASGDLSSAQDTTSSQSKSTIDGATKKKTTGSKTKNAKGFAKSSREAKATADFTIESSPPSSPALPTHRDAQEGAIKDCNDEVRETPLHTDAQDVLAVETAGAKRWKVYARPSMDFLVLPSSSISSKSNGMRDVYNLGKDADCFNAETLGTPPLIDAVLLPGDALFVPAGCPHETFAVSSHQEGAVVSSDPCAVHLTFGFMTLLWGLNYETLQRVSDAVEESNREDNEDEQEQRDQNANRVKSEGGLSMEGGSTEESFALRTRLEAPLPLGFVSNQPALLMEAQALASARVTQRETSSFDKNNNDSESVVAAGTFLEYHCEQLVGVLENAYTAAVSTQIPYARRAKSNEAALSEVLENIIF